MGTRGHAGMLPKYFLDESVSLCRSILSALALKTHFACVRFAPGILARYSLYIHFCDQKRYLLNDKFYPFLI